jgi:type IV pilus assembly protein PilB
MEFIGQLLITKGFISDTTLEKALALQITSNSGRPRIGEILCAQFGLLPDQLFATLAFQYSIPFCPVITDKVDLELVHDIPNHVFVKADFLPLADDGDLIPVVLCDPFDINSLLTIQALSGRIPQPMLTTPQELKRAVQSILKSDTMLKQSIGKISRDYENNQDINESKLSLEEIRERTESEPVVKMAELIFNEAIKQKASDIHIEPLEHSANIRYRVDGMLTQHMELSKDMFIPITSRIKILANLDIAEKRVPQDGRIRYEFCEEQFDFRVSTLPTHFGEKTVIRILKHDIKLLALDKIGFSQKELVSISEIIEKPQGMVFVTGPTGSGKSSTLFACLNAIRHQAINITTIEDPIEYKIHGVNQVQINEKAGVTFAATLRSILRQDPDVILVGEIRDRETAEIAIQASQTGHLVFSTLHTNDAISAITRLKDLGIPGFLISSSLLAILAQRLVRLLCPHCKQKGEVPKDILERWRIMLPGIPLPQSYNAHGCEACHNTGYKGRIGVFELAIMSETVRDLISQDSPESAIRKFFRQAGTKTLIQNGIDKIEQGLTTADELLRVVMVEDIVHLKETI